MLIFSSINLGCSKNLVDTQFLLWKFFTSVDFEQEKLQYCADPFVDEVEIVFLNTCGFISSGRQEMFDTIMALLNADKRICIWWCAMQYFQKLLAQFTEKNPPGQWWLDDYLFDEWTLWHKILKNDKVSVLSWEDCKKISASELIAWYSSKTFEDFIHMDTPRLYTNIHQWFEYLKIAEWCSNQCTFCIIPQIRGKQKSLSIDNILWEAKNMIWQWVKEIILIAQDTTRYGIDSHGKPALLELLQKLNKLEWDFVFRLLYLYPDVLTFKLIDELVLMEKFIPYFDIPLQHIHPKLLQSMWRFADVDKIKKFLGYIREKFDSVYVRTNFIVWFPGETDEMVEELNDFIAEDTFDNIAFFEYHDEPLAPSSKFGSHFLKREILREGRKSKFDLLKRFKLIEREMRWNW